MTAPPREVKIADSRVMGRDAVLVAATFLCWAGVGQLFDKLGSRVLSDTAGDLDLVWAGCLILAASFCWASWFRTGRADTAILEIGGISFLNLGCLVYLYALAERDMLSGSWFVIGLCTALIVNCDGRAWLLIRRGRELRRALR